MVKKKKGTKKGGKKGKKDAIDKDPVTLAPWGVKVSDIVRTPLGVDATVLGVSKGSLWLQWPGNVKAPLPNDAKTRADMERFGYVKRGNSAHIQRSIEERENLLFEQRNYGGPGPKSAIMVLPEPTGEPFVSPFTVGMPATAMSAG